MMANKMSKMINLKHILFFGYTSVVKIREIQVLNERVSLLIIENQIKSPFCVSYLDLTSYSRPLQSIGIPQGQ
jgi:hypothetical protein